MTAVPQHCARARLRIEIIQLSRNAPFTTPAEQRRAILNSTSVKAVVAVAASRCSIHADLPLFLSSRAWPASCSLVSGKAVPGPDPDSAHLWLLLLNQLNPTVEGMLMSAQHRCIYPQRNSQSGGMKARQR